MLGRLWNVIRDPGWSTWAAGGDFPMPGGNDSGQRVTRDTSLNLLAVYGCVSLISDHIATMPIHVYRELAGVKSQISEPGWISQPNLEVDRITFYVQALSSLLLDGNTFLVPTRDRLGRVQELHILPPDEVAVKRDGPGAPIVYDVSGRRFGGEMMHVRAFTLAGQVRGVNPIEAARQSVGLGLAAQAFGAGFFGRGTTMSGVIEYPGDVTTEQARFIKENWVRHHAGTANAHLPGVLGGGGSWKPLSITAEQAQFLETRKWQAAEVAGQLFRVDPAMVGIPVEGSNLTYQNMETRWTEHVRKALMPWMVRLEMALTSLLPRPQYVKFNSNAYLRADTKTRYETYKLGIDGRFLLPNEARAHEDEPPLEGGDQFPPAAPAAPSTGGTR